MPYRINVTFDIPDQADGPTTKTAQNAFRALNDVEEVVGKFNGDTQYNDVEWYGFDGSDELTQNSWTYSDEELFDSLMWHWKASRQTDGPEFDALEFVTGDAEDDAQATRVLREFLTRQDKAEEEDFVPDMYDPSRADGEPNPE